ncbi:hypothetical protein EVAR_58470_1 [Eumeta japonica]|uniref:Uncharacterized protein n=1 Tax=Eumeta variegata TaxID=151549 RepID=A0A4C1YKM5_EUMVA|nr:hypothetical protein EVAR_58470_1 [Eumeta japonica]
MAFTTVGLPVTDGSHSRGPDSGAPYGTILRSGPLRLGGDTVANIDSRRTYGVDLPENHRSRECNRRRGCLQHFDMKRERSLGAETVRRLGVQTVRQTGVYHRDKRGITVAARCTLRDTTHTQTRAEPDTPERGSKEH